MKKGTKIALVIGTIVLVGGAIGFVLYKRSQKPTEEMFDEFVKKSLASKNDVFEGMDANSRTTRLNNWKNNLTKKEAQTIIDNTKPTPTNDVERNQMDAILLPLYEKWLDL